MWYIPEEQSLFTQEELAKIYNERNFPYSQIKVEYLTKEEIKEKYNIDINLSSNSSIR